MSALRCTTHRQKSVDWPISCCRTALRRGRPTIRPNLLTLRCRCCLTQINLSAWVLYEAGLPRRLRADPKCSALFRRLTSCGLETGTRRRFESSVEKSLSIRLAWWKTLRRKLRKNGRAVAGQRESLSLKLWTKAKKSCSQSRRLRLGGETYSGCGYRSVMARVSEQSASRIHGRNW